jgi:hypothetical protein
LYRLNEQKRAIQPTKRSNSYDKSRRFIRQNAAIHTTNQGDSADNRGNSADNRNDSADNRGGSADEKGISTKTQLQTITMQFPSHVGEGQGWGQ